MAWQVIEFMDNNPQLTTKQLIAHFATEMEVDKEVKNLQVEVDRVMEIREELRPLYGKKLELDTKLSLLDSDFDSDVMVRYPPRKGSDKERKAYKAELQQASPDYQENSREVEGLKEKIGLLETEMQDIQQRAKNARRLLETFNKYVEYILESSKEAEPATETGNTNVF